jgi:hypothetical protein
MHLLAMLLAAAAAASPGDTPATCFDWAVVAQLDHQTFLGFPPIKEGEISLESVFRYDVRVRETAIGEHVPSHMRLIVGAHTELVPWAARRVVLFLRKDDGGHISVIARGGLDRRLPRAAWARKVNDLVSEYGLARCGLGA